MATFSTTLTTTRTTLPDPVALAAAVIVATGDPTAVIGRLDPQTWRGKKASDWTPAQIAAVQTALDSTAADSPQKLGQRLVDAFPIEQRAALFALLDQINVLRGDITTLGINRPAITPAQAIAAIRNKAGTL